MDGSSSSEGGVRLPSECGEVFEKLEADGLAFFGVELGCEEVVSADHGGEGDDIVGLRGGP